MNLLYVSLSQCLSYKIFIGHNISNTLLLSSWLIFQIREKIAIINIFKTIRMLKLSYSFIKHIITIGLPFWFINLDLSKENLIKNSATFCGEFYCTKNWVRGLLSNFFAITKTFRHYLIKKEFVKVRGISNVYNKWFLTRFTWPRGLFISHVKSSMIVSKEASSVKIPIVALVDTDVKTHIYNLPLGSNDDSLISVGFMNNVISRFVLSNKYKNVLSWYVFNKRESRTYSLVKWLKTLKNFYKVNNNIFNKKLKMIISFNGFNNIKRGLMLFFSRSFNFQIFKKRREEPFFNLNFDYYYKKKKNSFFNRYKIYYYSKLKYRNRIKFRRWRKSTTGLSRVHPFVANIKKLLIKRRMKIRRKVIQNVTNSFHSFYYYMYIYFMNKIRICVDFYRNKKSSFNILKLGILKKRKYGWENKTWLLSRYLWKKKRSNNLGVSSKLEFPLVDVSKIAFYFFYWKLFISFIGVKLKLK